MKACVETYGCTMNQGEGLMLEGQLADLGYEITAHAAEADLVVLNTCTVIRETEARMLKRMAELSSQRKKLVVAGCVAAVQPDEAVKRAPEALIIPPRDYSRFAPLVEGRFGRGGVAIPLARERTTAILPIAQGCLGSCSYCITKLARGTLDSYPLDRIVGEAQAGLGAGARELLITAQDTAAYGMDLGRDLGNVLDAVTSLPGDFMVRVGMMNPESLERIVDRFLPAWMSPKVYKFVHLPVQSGSDRILEAMNRGHTAEAFESLVMRLRAVCPDMTLSTDVITGFPGEEEEDHQATVELIRRVRPDIVNVTRFSPRPGTAAARARHQIPGWISKERSREMTALRMSIAEEINRRHIGREEAVLVTEPGKEGTMIGRTAAYRPVVVPGALPLGNWVTVRIADAAPTYLLGTVAQGSGLK